MVANVKVIVPDYRLQTAGYREVLSGLGVNDGGERWWWEVVVCKLKLKLILDLADMKAAPHGLRWWRAGLDPAAM